MKISNILFFISIYICSFNVYSQNIAIVNIQELIDNNLIYNNSLKDIEYDQQNYLRNFESKENELKLIFKEIEDSRLILSEKEINFKIDDYNNQLSEFTNLIEEFNIHYQNQIIIMRESILKEIIVLLEKYATENNIDLILDSNSYLIASNTLDITNKINIKLEKINIKLEYENFEKN